MPLSRLANHPIRPAHLDRQAIISSRQSTMIQGRAHTGSTARQYDLGPRAQDLGWPRERSRVLDQDQGQSGASAAARAGVQGLVAEGGLKHAGAGFCLEASRLARSCTAWYRRLAIGALPDTLVVDEEGVADPGQDKDRLRRGCKGPMSAAQLHWRRQRLWGGQLAKAELGRLRFRRPGGLVYDPAGRVVIAPDQEVCAAVRLAFARFAQPGSARAVVTPVATPHLRFPTRLWGGGHDGALIWGRLTSGPVLSSRHNPLYAGGYVYGRSVTRMPVLPGEAPRIKGRTRQITRDDWPLVGLDAPPGSMTGEPFQRHQPQLDAHRTWRPEDRRGAGREGAALLQAIGRCGRGGRRMAVRYLQDGITPLYEGNPTHTPPAARTCQTRRGDPIDAAVARRFLDALHPAPLAVALAARDQIDARARQIARHWPRRKERAQDEAALARRRSGAIAPETRLVARALEREWKENLASIETLAREYAAWPPHPLRPVSPEERQRILALAQDMPAVWHAPTTTNTERTPRRRGLVREVTLTGHEKIITIALRWQTGALTMFALPRRRRSWEGRQTEPCAGARLRELASAYTAQQIAVRLNADGGNAGLGGRFTPSKGGWIGGAYGIATGCPERPQACPRGQRGDGRSSAPKAAELLPVQGSTISEWGKQGRLDGRRSAPMSPRWMRLTPELLAAWRRPSRRRHRRRHAGA
jgi:DNA invertase Pin-like site-specific DNA recombinase